MFKKVLLSLRHRWAKTSSKRFATWLRERGCKVGARVEFHGLRDISIDTTRPSLVEIGDDVVFTRGCTVLTHGYDWFVLRNLFGEVLASSGPVRIGNNVFVGMHAIILKGVTVGDNSIIGAGSVVASDVPANVVVAGNPARVVCSIEEYFVRRKQKYVSEALIYAASIQTNLKRAPVPSDFWEEFPLFTACDSDYPELPIKAQLGRSYAAFCESHVPVFAGFDEFLANASIK